MKWIVSTGGLLLAFAIVILSLNVFLGSGTALCFYVERSGWTAITARVGACAKKPQTAAAPPEVDISVQDSAEESHVSH